MAIIRATCTIESSTSLPEDRATNTYHFDVAGISGSTLGLVADLLQDLYVDSTAETPLTELMSNELCGDIMGIQLYNLDDPEPRVPILSRGVTINPSASGGLPAEVALVVSFQANPMPGEIQARRRGRIYLPWLRETDNTVGRPSSGLVSTVADAFTEFLANSDDAADVDWIVWSPTSNAGFGVAQGWIDNAWDTQRRRGFSATSRTTFP